MGRSCRKPRSLSRGRDQVLFPLTARLLQGEVEPSGATGEGWRRSGWRRNCLSSGLTCLVGDCPGGEGFAVDRAQNLRSLGKGWEERHSFAALAALAFF